MTCTIPSKMIDETIAFHGHSCPGLVIGIRAAEYARREFPHAVSTDLVCVTETDMCGVDGIQYLTGCTFGKGNLVHRDYGKAAFSFYDRQTRRGIRLVLKPDARGGEHPELKGLMAKSGKGALTQAESQRLDQLRSAMKDRLMQLPLEELFIREELEFKPPRAARVLQSLICENCGEETMESRTRRFAGQTLCIPCYLLVEQKI